MKRNSIGDISMLTSKKIFLAALGTLFSILFAGCGDNTSSEPIPNDDDDNPVCPSTQTLVPDAGIKDIIQIEDENGCITYYKDLNGNGEVDIYEDWSKTTSERVNNLLSLMNNKEKAGLLFNTILPGPGDSTGAMIGTENDAITNQNARLFFTNANNYKIKARANYANELQKIAESSRLGIPILLTSDMLPSYPTTAVGMIDFAPAPGIAAGSISDTELPFEFGSYLKDCYRSIGVRLAFAPQSDIATEPRWNGSKNCFGENAETVGEITAGIIKGLQGQEELNSEGVASVIKHFPGMGPQKNGIDAKASISSGLIAYGNATNFNTHLLPVDKAIESGVSGVMAGYGAPEGVSDVQATEISYNSDILKTKLAEHDFSGLVFSETDALYRTNMLNVTEASTLDRAISMINAGCDVINNVKIEDAATLSNGISELESGSLDTSSEKILTLMFNLGLFDNPYIVNDDGVIDASSAESIEDNSDYSSRATDTLLNQIILLKNTVKNNKAFLPMDAGIPYKQAGSNSYYVSGYSSIEIDYQYQLASGYSTVINSFSWSDMGLTEGAYPTIEEARAHYSDYTVITVDAPERINDETGDPDGLLSYYYNLTNEDDGYADEFYINGLNKVKELYQFIGGSNDNNSLLIVIVKMKRSSAILDELYNNCDCLIAYWGSPTKYLFDVLHSVNSLEITGKLPASLYSTNEDAELQNPAVADDNISSSDWCKIEYGLSFPE